MALLSPHIPKVEIVLQRMAAVCLRKRNFHQSVHLTTINFLKVDVEDYSAVMAIRPGTYNGIDYLPARYKTLMTNHIGYAASYGGKLVAFECITFVDEGETMLRRALRVSKHFEGQGLIRRLKEFSIEQNKGDINLKRQAYAFHEKEHFEKRSALSYLVLKQDRLHFSCKLSEMVQFVAKKRPSIVRLLQKDDLKDIIKSKLLTEKLFPNERLIANWNPYRILESNVDHIYNECCLILRSGTDTQLFNSTQSLTFGSGYIAEGKVIYNVQMFGTFTVERIACHIAEHIKKCEMFKTDNITLIVHFDRNVQNSADIIEAVAISGSERVTGSFESYFLEEPI